jgi:hypothetical protein
MKYIVKKENCSFISYVFSSTKLENKSIEQVLPESMGVGGHRGWGRWGGSGPNNVYTCICE